MSTARRRNLVEDGRSLARAAIVVSALLAASAVLAAAQSSAPPALIPIDIRLPSPSTGSADGTLAVRVHTPIRGATRYPEGAPVLIWVPGGVEAKGIGHGLPPTADDIVCITFVFPGATDPVSGLASDGTYDYRGEACIAALRDVILYAAGEIADDRGRTIDELLPVPAVHDNIGLIGASNGGNLLPAVAALHGRALAGRLRYVIQWETPVSSQIATRDFGRIWLKPTSAQGDYANPRGLGYDPLVLPVDYRDLAYDPDHPTYPLVHDGTGDGRYTTVHAVGQRAPVPDLNLDGTLDRTEDFPLDTYPIDGERVTYSRPVMAALIEQDVFDDDRPEELVPLEEAEAYWDLRESVRLTGAAMRNVPKLAAMILCGVRDHVQARPDKPHIRQAFDSWDAERAWVKINPSPDRLAEVDPSLVDRTLPLLPPNTPPDDWSDPHSYAMPVDVPAPVYQLAAVYEMADRARRTGSVDAKPSFQPPITGSSVTFVASEGIGRIAVSIRSPDRPRYPEGAPVVVDVSGFFTAATGFKDQLDPDRLGAVVVSYLWPGRADPRTGISSEGTFDYGGPDDLEALRDVIRFATGEIDDVDGRSLDETVDLPILYDVAGLYAFSHSGIAATNVLALHGDRLQGVRFFVGRENPTIDPLYPLEPGHWDDRTGRPVHNPFYDPSGYTPTSIAIDYSTVAWSTEHGRPVFRSDGTGRGEYLCSSKHPRMYGKDYWSTDLLRALLDNGALTRERWPETLATPEEAAEHWPLRTTVHNYGQVGAHLPDLKVMLVFAADDHVQTALDKPHIHQAYDGFHGVASLWCRLNPDRSYVEQVLGREAAAGIPDHPANREPGTWAIARSWGYAPGSIAGFNTNEVVPLAAVAEMCDRAYHDIWEPDLDTPLVSP